MYNNFIIDSFFLALRHLTDTTNCLINFQKLISAFFIANNLYFFYTLPYLSYLYNVGVPIEKKPAPGDHILNSELCRSNVVSIKCRNTFFFYPSQIKRGREKNTGVIIITLPKIICV